MYTDYSMSNTTVYYIIVTYNNKDLVDECINSLHSQTYKTTRIVLVDNGSSDGTVEYVTKNYPDIHLIDAGENLGFAKANNIGIDYAKNDSACGYISLINSDATIDNKWTETLVTFADQQKHSACFQTPTLDYYDHSVLDSRGITVDRYGRPTQLGYREKYKRKTSHVVFGVNAAACLISVDFLKSQPFSDYFDEDMWMYIEDVDLAARSTMLGWKNWCVDGAFAYHMGSASSSKNPGFSIFYIYRNNLSMLVKNFPLGILLQTFVGAIVTDIMTLLKLVKHKDKVALKALIKGRSESIKSISIYIKKRKKITSARSISHRDLITLMDAK